MDWYIKTFEQLNTNELYDLLKLRVDVFVVEQECFYPDLDDLDRISSTKHLFCYQNKKMVAYCRVLAPDIVYDNESAIGRVIISEDVRGQKLGYTLMEKAINVVNKHWPKHTCHISAQQHLHNFYQRLGFEQISEMYLEDGIPHIAMRRQAN